MNNPKQIKSAKKVWKKPEIILIDQAPQSGFVYGGVEGHATKFAFPGATFFSKYNGHS